MRYARDLWIVIGWSVNSSILRLDSIVLSRHVKDVGCVTAQGLFVCIDDLSCRSRGPRLRVVGGESSANVKLRCVGALAKETATSLVWSRHTF